MDPNNPLRFQNLPFDIHFEVAKQLDYPGIVSLASTNRFFHQILDPIAILSRSEVADFCENQDRHFREIGKELFACYKCFRFFPKKKFGRPAWFGRDAWQNRFCLDCSGKLKHYKHGKGIWNGTRDIKYYFCHNCCRYQTKSTKCQGNLLDESSGADEVAEALVLCTKSPRRECQGLETLPTHIMFNIASFLDFHDVLRLAQASYNLNDVVKPNSWVSLPTRYRFVRDKWAKDVADLEFSNIENFPCYMCFRIRPKAKFPWKQLEMAEKEPGTAWKMRCQRCVAMMGCSNKSLTRIEHRRREMCDVCKCIKHTRQPCGGCMELYVQGTLDRETVYAEEENIFDGLDIVFDEDRLAREAREAKAFRETCFVWEEFGAWGDMY
jgi:hypothetical protein